MNIKFFARWAGLVAVVLAAFTACKTSEPPPPTSPVTAGRPQVTITGASVERIQKEFRSFFVGRGYLERRSDHVNKLTFDRAHQQRSSDSPPDKALRVRVTLTPQRDGTCLVEAMSYVVEGWRQALETEFVELNGFTQIQYFLEQIQKAVETAP